jgi:hypothetical protein
MIVRILLLILILLPTTSNADQGLKISCLNMKYVVIGRKHDSKNSFINLNITTNNL